MQPWEALIHVMLESQRLERGKNEFATSIYTEVSGSQYSLGQTNAVMCSWILKYTFTGHWFSKELEKWQVEIWKKQTVVRGLRSTLWYSNQCQIVGKWSLMRDG